MRHLEGANRKLMITDRYRCWTLAPFHRHHCFRSESVRQIPQAIIHIHIHTIVPLMIMAILTAGSLLFNINI